MASPIFWPVGFFLAETSGWRIALFIYAAFALLTLPLHLSLPKERLGEESYTTEDLIAPPLSPAAKTTKEQSIYGSLYALIFTLLNFLKSGMSTHMITLLAGLGLTAVLSVWVFQRSGESDNPFHGSVKSCSVLACTLS